MPQDPVETLGLTASYEFGSESRKRALDEGKDETSNGQCF